MSVPCTIHTESTDIRKEKELELTQALIARISYIQFYFFRYYTDILRPLVNQRTYIFYEQFSKIKDTITVIRTYI